MTRERDTGMTENKKGTGITKNKEPEDDKRRKAPGNDIKKERQKPFLFDEFSGRWSALTYLFIGRHCVFSQSFDERSIFV